MAVNPAPPLLAAAHRTADTEFEGQQHLLQSAAFGMQYEADAHDGHPGAEGSGALGFGLPGRTDIQPPLHRTGGHVVLAHHLVATRPVETDRGSRDQRLYTGLLHPVDQAAGDMETAVEKALLARRGPSAGTKIFPGKIDGGVDATRILRLGHGRHPLWKQVQRVLRGARPDHHFVALRQQMRAQRTSYETGTTRDQNTHRLAPLDRAAPVPAAKGVMDDSDSA